MGRQRRARWRARACQVIVVSPRRDAVLLVKHLDSKSDFYGRYTGFIDAMRNGESPEDAAVRITKHQAGVAIGSAKECAVLDMMELGMSRAPQSSISRPVTTREHEMLAETDSFEPNIDALAASSLHAVWFPLGDALPFDRMPGDDAIWYPRVLRGERVRGVFAFRGNHLVVRRVFAVR